MINGFPLNSVPINGIEQAETSPPVELIPGHSSVWQVDILLDGVSVTPFLSGRVSIDREEGAAGVATFVLLYPPGTPVPADLFGAQAEILYREILDGQLRERRLLTGAVAESTWSVTDRLMSITCTDRRQQRLEAMSLAEIDTLTGGFWSADVFGPLTGRSRRDYAEERLSTVPASLDASVDGVLRVTSWYATAPHWRFGPGSTLYQSVTLDAPNLRGATNRAELEVNYRYQRLWQLNENYSWQHVGEHGLTEIQGFCQWRTWSTETPSVEMVESAIEGSGQVLIGTPRYQLLPASSGNPCGDGVPWINTNTAEQLLLAADVTGGRRWTQTVTETYRITLATAAGLVEATRVVSRDSLSFEVEDERVSDWENSLTSVAQSDLTGPPSLPVGVPSGGWAWTPNGGQVDVIDEARRVDGLRVCIRRAVVELISAHRQTTVSWDIPTSLALDVDLVHTLELDDQYTRARGKCRRVQHRLDMDSGEAITTLSIAVMRGGGDSDVLVVPGRPDTSVPPLSSTPGPPDAGRLPTQIGGRLNHPPNASGPTGGGPVEPYDDDLDGFAGNYSTTDDLTAEQFPRRFTLTAREIPELYRDELTRSTETLLRVGIPNDLLEL
ncbi:hypothetical protein [Pseudomonas phage PotUPM1]|nr:hypothetical protein [Pseudomonas phage PotUPM1]